MPNLLRVAALLVAMATPAAAQITQSTLNNEIETRLPSGQPGVLTAQNLRTVLSDMVTAIFQSIPPTGVPVAGWTPIAISPTASVWGPGGGGGGGGFPSLPPFSTVCNPTGITATSIACAAITTGDGLSIDPITNVLSITEPPPAFTVVPPLEFTGGNTSLQITGATGTVLAGSGPAFVTNPSITGPVTVGSGYTGGNLAVGDISVGRPSAPSTGAMFLGNTGNGFFSYDGTSTYSFNGTISAVGQLASTGASSGIGINSRSAGFALAGFIFSSAGNLEFLVSPLGSDALVINGTTGATTFNKQIISAFGTPTIASGACGTGTNGTISGGNQSGIVTIGAAPTTACVVSFSATITAPKACVISPGNAAAAATGTTVAWVAAPSTTGWTINGSALANTVYSYVCL